MMGKLKRESVEEVQNESAPTAKQVKMGIGIARDKRYAGGNMTGASKAMNKVKKGLDRHPAVSKELRKQNESVNEISRSMTPMNKRFGKTVDPKKFDAYKKFVKKNNVDEPTVRMIRDNPDAAESKRMMKNKNVAQAVSLYKASMKESVTELSMSMKDVSKTGLSKKATGSVDKDKLKKDLEKLKKNLGEKLKVSDGMGSWIKDFQGSDAPQFKGKDKEERRDMAIAAYLSAKKGD